MISRYSIERLLLAVTVIVFCGVLDAGLRPFHAPANQVFWGPQSNELRLGPRGTVLGLGPLSPNPNAGFADRSVEIWVEPERASASRTILSFYDPTVPRGFSLRQSLSGLELRLSPSQAWSRAESEHIFVDDALRQGKTAFWAVTSGPLGTAIFRNATLVKSSAFRISGREFSGRLVLANSPVLHDSWSGRMRGLAIYNHELTLPQIQRHYATWVGSSRPQLSAEDACVALYLFDEHAGRTVHNKIGSGTDLWIPPAYVILNSTVLDPVWRTFNWGWGFWSDALFNFAGFIPVGFCSCAYLSVRSSARPVLVSSLLGATLSLFIELLQTHLPTRDSSMSDLITNSAGAAFGAVLSDRVLSAVTRFLPHRF